MAARALAATRADALDRLAAFLPHAGRDYAADRNHDNGPDGPPTTSQLSAAIRRRVITEEEVARAAWDMHGPAATKFVNEVIWRSYFRGWLELRPQVWRDYLAEVARDEARLGREGGLARAYAAAIDGRTGIDAFDAWARELLERGWLHNHARMSYASIWVYTLGLPWALGAAHMHRHLVCGCPAANTLNWRWGCGGVTAGKTYRASASIIRDMSGGRFLVEAKLARDAPPLPFAIPAAGALQGVGAVDPDARTGLWITSEDCHPESIPFGASIAAVAVVDGIGGEPGAAKRAAANASLDDATQRAAAHYGLKPARLPEQDLEDAMRDWAGRHDLRQVVTPYAPVGAVADRVASVAEALSASGVRLVQVRRRWDELAWPRATKGFFAFKSILPELLA